MKGCSPFLSSLYLWGLGSMMIVIVPHHSVPWALGWFVCSRLVVCTVRSGMLDTFERQQLLFSARDCHKEPCRDPELSRQLRGLPPCQNIISGSHHPIPVQHVHFHMFRSQPE